MSVWDWALIALCAAGALLAFVGLLQALIGGVRLNKRLSALRESPFVTKLESLQIQFDRLARTGADARELERRTKAALDSMRASMEESGLYPIRDSLRGCAAELRALAEELS